MKRSVFFLALVFMVGFSACVLSPNTPKNVVRANDAPLVIQPVEMDMGEVMEGKEARTTLILRNTGAFPVHVEKVETSCGCTAVSLGTRELAPGAFTPLHVRVDTTAKLGAVRKGITVFDSQGRKAQAWLTLKVKPNPHMGAMRGKGIFSGKCATCHFEPAEGKVAGASIYKAVCVMCHGEAGKGAYAPVLRGRNAAFMVKVLGKGLGRQMPSFSRKKNGPLNREQITSVAKWLSELDE